MYQISMDTAELIVVNVLKQCYDDCPEDEPLYKESLKRVLWNWMIPMEWETKFGQDFISYSESD